ncbi:class I SAM-dependent methyltransferase [Puia sp. P3]|uniref:class I SAM-dependent methyltransferase n=1 Tax=Puia sp. P3 TaxID=3423952 RepID=UPI003D671A28
MSLLKSILPAEIYQIVRKTYQRLRLKRIGSDDQYSDMSHSKIFSEIYDNGLWSHGKEANYLPAGAKYYSGSGSYNRSSAEYIRLVTDYIRAHNITTITDIGCGDFNIGRQICEQNPSLSYNGIDVVPSLIQYNNDTFASEKIHFFCLDTLHQKIPRADLLLIRQVLQHLSNTDIITLTSNCFPGFPHILITEHQPKPQYLIRENIEKASGPNTRVGSFTGSGVYLDKSPFHYRWQRLLSIEDDNPHTQINTYKIL